MEFTIRDANIDDLKNGLLEVYIEGYKYHKNDRPDIFVIDDDDILKEDLINTLETKHVLVAVDNNDHILGYLYYKIKESYTNKLDVNELVIKEEYRGKGIGKSLMNKAKEIAILHNCSRIELNCWLFNENALSMYEHIGFQKQRTIFEMPL